MTTTANQKMGQDIERMVYPLLSILVLAVLDVVWFFNSSLVSSGLPKNNAIGMTIAVVIGCPICLLMVRWVGRLDFNRIWQIFLVWIGSAVFFFYFFSRIHRRFLTYFFWLDTVILFVIGSGILALITWPVTSAIFRWVECQEFNRSAIIRKILLGMNVFVILRIIAVLSVKDRLELGSMILSTGAYKNWDLWMITGPLITIAIPVFIGLCF